MQMSETFILNDEPICHVCGGGSLKQYGQKAKVFPYSRGYKLYQHLTENTKQKVTFD